MSEQDPKNRPEVLPENHATKPTSSSTLYDEKSDEYFGFVKFVALNKLIDADLGRVLDVGGGNGTTARFLLDTERASGAVVLDPFASETRNGDVAIYHESADEQKTFTALEKREERFKTVMFLDVLEHLFDPWAVLEWIKPVMEKDGRLVVCIPNARFVALWVPLVFKGRFDYKTKGIMDRTHIRWFTRTTVREMIEEAGYRIDVFDAHVEPRLALLNKLTLGLFRGFFEYQYIIQATKVD